MSSRKAVSDDEIGAVIFSFLGEKSVPCTVSEICSCTEGLGKSQNKVKELIDQLCEIGIVSQLKNQYILTEKMESFTAKSKDVCEEDGVFYPNSNTMTHTGSHPGAMEGSATGYRPGKQTDTGSLPGAMTRSDTGNQPVRQTDTGSLPGAMTGSAAGYRPVRQTDTGSHPGAMEGSATGYRPGKQTETGSLPGAMTWIATGNHPVRQTDTGSLPGALTGSAAGYHPVRQTETGSHQGYALVEPEVKNTPKITRNSQAVVPRQSYTMSRSEQSSFICDEQNVKNYTENIRKIMSVLQESTSPLKAAKIAQLTGIGSSRSSVNKFLYHLEKKDVLVKTGNTWSCRNGAGACSDEAIQVYGADLAKQPAAKDKRSSSSGDMSCGCPNAGPNCNHYKIEQHNHYHQHNIQVGDQNQIFVGSGALPRSNNPQ